MKKEQVLNTEQLEVLEAAKTARKRMHDLHGYLDLANIFSEELDALLFKAEDLGIRVSTMSTHLKLSRTAIGNRMRHRLRVVVRALENEDVRRTRTVDVPDRVNQLLAASQLRGHLGDLAAGWTPNGEPSTETLDPEELRAELDTLRGRYEKLEKEVKKLREEERILDLQSERLVALGEENRTLKAHIQALDKPPLFAKLYEAACNELDIRISKLPAQYTAPNSDYQRGASDVIQALRKLPASFFREVSDREMHTKLSSKL